MAGEKLCCGKSAVGMLVTLLGWPRIGGDWVLWYYVQCKTEDRCGTEVHMFVIMPS